MKRLLVTGADGFTGRHLSNAALKLGYDVFPFLADLTDSEAVAAEVVRVAPTHVAHLAAISAVTHADEEAFYRVNLFGSLNLLKALERLTEVPKKVLLASSANVYGNYDGGAIPETACPKPVNHYAMSKLAMEYMAATYANSLPIVIVRPFNYTGVGHDLRFVIPKIVDHFARRATMIELGNLDVYREYNDVRWVCQVYLKLLEKGIAGEIYNICSGQAISLNQIVSVLSGLTGWQPDLKENPAFVRKNEVYRLSGDPSKLEVAIGSCRSYGLVEMLALMLEARKH